MSSNSLWRSISVIFLMATLLFATSWTGYADQGVPVFMYHSIINKNTDPYCLSPQVFEEQMKLLSDEGYKTLTASELLDYWMQKRSTPEKSVLLTFDDGYKDNFTNAFPTLKKYRLKATIFLATGLIGKPNYLTWQEIKEMHRSGLIDFQSHTVHHPNLLKLTAQKQMAEFELSKRMIESQLNNHVRVFAYPFGYHNRFIMNELKKCGYQMAFDSDKGASRISQGLFNLDRLEVTANSSFSELLTGKYKN
ncbi:polysaccharide deacetylase family protein [Brevibacillus ginsengisoli]|uniref:polysaccharide deacetylase family protein n=1 Tax=Brevibacillus ginsengisoli TaxID=363854 RepID=UPI003CF11923